MIKSGSMDKKSRITINIFIFLVVVFLLVFILPFYTPRKTPTVSASYDYQFNNQMSVLALCVSLIVASILVYKYLNEQIQLFNIEKLFTKNINSSLSVKSVFILFLIHSLVILTFYLLGAYYNYGEENYFLLRVDRLSLGQQPYKDFEYAYGILLIYLPKLVTDLFHFPTSVKGYYISLTILNGVGIYLLYFVINSFNVSKRKKALIFFSIGLVCLPLTMGMNYILIRFITPIASLIVLGQVIGKLGSPTFKNSVLIALAAIAVSLINFVISIEVGLAVFLSICGYLFFSIILNKKWFNVTTLLVCGVLVSALLLLFGKNFSLVIKVFAAGGNNWVVVPAPAIVLFIASFLIVNIVFCISLFKKNFSFLTCSLLIFNIIMLAGAFGRCDPGHVFWYGLSSLITAWMMTSLNRRYFRFYSISFILIFIVGLHISGIYWFRTQYATLIFKPFILNHKVKTLNEIASRIHYDTTKINDYAYKVNDKIDFAVLDKYKKIAVPFDADADIYLFLLKRHIFCPDYYTGAFLNAYTQEQIDSKLKDLQDPNHKYMIIPEDVLNYKYMDKSASERIGISIIFLYPFTFTSKRDSSKMYVPIYAYIQNNYKPVKVIKKGFVLVERTS